MIVSSPDSTLPEALAISQPLVTWLLRSGVGYGEFAAALKPLFLAQAQQELERTGQKVTDSALSLLSGLHRKDVRALRAQAQSDWQSALSQRNEWGKPSLANQVLTRWLAEEVWPDVLPLSGSEPSFEALVKSVSSDVHSRSVLQELQRLGLVRETEGQVHLQRQAFVPDARSQQARRLMAGSVADHMHAGMHNLSTEGEGRFLEQSVFADGLSPESVKQLHQLANALWAQALQQVVEAAKPMCERDAQHPAPQRFRLGHFSYSAPEEDPSGAADQGPSS